MHDWIPAMGLGIQMWIQVRLYPAGSQKDMSFNLILHHIDIFIVKLHT